MVFKIQKLWIYLLKKVEQVFSLLEIRQEEKVLLIIDT